MRPVLRTNFYSDPRHHIRYYSGCRGTAIAGASRIALATQSRLWWDRYSAVVPLRPARLRIKHRGLTPHQHVALARRAQAVLGLSLSTSPRCWPCHGPCFRTSAGTRWSKLSAVAEHEHVHVGDRAEGLVATYALTMGREALMLI